MVELTMIEAERALAAINAASVLAVMEGDDDRLEGLNDLYDCIAEAIADARRNEHD